MRHRNLPLVALGVLLTTACVEPPPEPEPAPVPTTAVFAPPPGDTDQSRWLLGANVDGSPGYDAAHHYAVGTIGRDALNRIVTVAFDGLASLRGVDNLGGVHVGADPWFNDLRLFGAAGTELKLRVVSSAAGVTSYTIQRRGSPTSPWADPCGGGQARVVSGSFTRTGVHEATAGRLTFSCDTGVTAKCIDWGYPPGGVYGSTSWQIHQACTRMGRGDYCANGTPHTRTGTYIQIFDDIGVNAPPPPTWPELTEWPPPHTEYYFEAAWRPDQPALCMSRLRWQSLPLGPQCAGLLPDPREDTTAKYCDHQSTGDLRARGAVLFNTSRYNDIKLDAWQRGADRVATVRGFHAEPGGEVPPLEPFSGYAYTHSIASLLRSIPEGHTEQEVRQVSMFEDAAGRLVLGATASPPPGYTQVIDTPIEGWLMTSLGTDMVPLRMFLHPTTGDRMTDVDAPDGYDEVGILGYALESE